MIFRNDKKMQSRNMIFDDPIHIYDKYDKKDEYLYQSTLNAQLRRNAQMNRKIN